MSFEACSFNVHGGICLKSENLQQKKVVASGLGGLKVMDGKEEEAVDMMTIKEEQDEIYRTALEADSPIKIQKRGKSVIMFYVFLLEPGSRIHASPRAWLAGSEQSCRLQDKKYPLFSFIFSFSEK